MSLELADHGCELGRKACPNEAIALEAEGEKQSEDEVSSEESDVRASPSLPRQALADVMERMPPRQSVDQLLVSTGLGRGPPRVG